MLEREKPWRPAPTDVEGTEFQTHIGPVDESEPDCGDFEIDRELQAAIEYKIATSGVRGAELVLDLLNIALRRHVP